MSYVELQQLLDEASAGAKSYEKSCYVEALSDDAIAVIADQLPRKSSPLSVLLVYRLDGAYSQVGDDDTAFSGGRSPRYAIFISGLASTPELLAADRAWVRSFWDALRPYAIGIGSYVNGMAEFEEDRVRASYGAAKYQGLATIKAEYDPENVFHHNANIKPAPLLGPASITATPIRRGLGITAGLDPRLARDLARPLQTAGVSLAVVERRASLPGMELLAQFAAGAPQLELGVGVLPIDRHQPAHIAAEIDRLGLDPTKLWMGWGPVSSVRRSTSCDGPSPNCGPSFRTRRASSSPRCGPGCAISAARSPTVYCSTGCCPRKRPRRAAGYRKEPPKQDVRPRSSPRTYASLLAPTRCDGSRPRSANTAISTRPINNISMP